MTVKVAARRVARLHPRLTPKARRALRKALAARRRAWVWIDLRARDAIGNTTSRERAGVPVIR